MLRRKLTVLLVVVALSFLFEGLAIAKSAFNIEEQFLNQARIERVRITIVMISGEKLDGYIKSFDDNCLLVESGGDLLLYKHAISSISSADGSFRMNQLTSETLE